MIHRISFLYATFFLLHFIHSNVISGDLHNKKLQEINQKIAPKNTIFAFDLHETLMNYNKGLGDENTLGVCNKILQYALYGVCFQAVMAHLGIENGLNIAGSIVLMVVVDFFARLMLSKLQDGYYPVLESLFDRDYLLRFLKSEFIDWANLYSPHKAMFSLLKQLKAEGYTIWLASDVGPEALSVLKKRYTEEFSYFDAFFSPNKDNNYLSKNQPKKYFHNLTNHGDGKQIIFVDDRKSNCDGAEECGEKIYSLHYKSFEQCNNTLSGLGVFSLKKKIL